MSANHPGQKLKALREAKGLKQEELADMLGVRQQTVAKWENGHSEPRPKQRKSLADMFDFRWLDETARFIVDRRQEAIADALLVRDGQTVRIESKEYKPNDQLLSIGLHVYNKIEPQYRAYFHGHTGPKYYESDTLFALFMPVELNKRPSRLLLEAKLFRLAVKVKLDPAKRAYLMQVTTDGTPGMQMSMRGEGKTYAIYAPLFGVNVFRGNDEECAEMLVGLEENSDFDLKIPFGDEDDYFYTDLKR